MEKCPKCGKKKIDDGFLGADIGYMTNHRKSLIGGWFCKVEAYACANCGHLQLTINPERLRKVTSKFEESE
jgi:hypothetical protein